MANILDLIAQVKRQGSGPFALDLGEEHLGAREMPQELKPLAGAFRFTPVEHDPFAPPEPAKSKKKGA